MLSPHAKPALGCGPIVLVKRVTDGHVFGWCSTCGIAWHHPAKETWQLGDMGGAELHAALVANGSVIEHASKEDLERAGLENQVVMKFLACVHKRLGMGNYFEEYNAKSTAATRNQLGRSVASTVGHMRSIWHLLGADSPEEGLHVATANERLDVMRALIEQGVDINCRIPTIMSGQTSETALHLAATYGLVRPAELLVSSGAALDLLDGLELTPLMCACSCGGSDGSRVAMLLLIAGADATVVRQGDEMTALKFAAKECKPEVIQTLIEKGATVDGPANTDQTALVIEGFVAERDGRNRTRR